MPARLWVFLALLTASTTSALQQSHSRTGTMLLGRTAAARVAAAAAGGRQHHWTHTAKAATAHLCCWCATSSSRAPAYSTSRRTLSSSSSHHGPGSSAAVRTQDCYLVQFDGGSRGNPGISGAGAAIYWLPHTGDVTAAALAADAGWCGAPQRQCVWTASIYVGDAATCNEAEYTGVVQGLTAAKSLGIKKLLVQGDSQLVVRQLLGEYKVKSPGLRPLYQQAASLLSAFDDVALCHIERALNGDADALANRAMDTQETEVDTCLQEPGAQ